MIFDPEDEYLREFCRVTSDGYVEISATKIKVRRFLMQAKEGQQVDHKNNNRADNRKDNLRFSTQSQNMYNRSKGKKPTSSIYKGVFWEASDKMWRARIRVNGMRFSLGSYNCEHKAARAYNEAAKLWHGEFAKLNEVL